MGKCYLKKKPFKNDGVSMLASSLMNREEIYPKFDQLEGPEILVKEVENAIKSMKNGKAPGDDGVTSEMLQALDQLGVTRVTELCNKIYDTGHIPEDLKKSTFLPIPKKSKAVNCSDYRTISLMSHVTKVLLKVILQRNKTKIDVEISETQSGFRKGRGTREGIFNLRTINERYLEKGKDVYICFIDNITKRRSIESTMKNCAKS